MGNVLKRRFSPYAEGISAIYYMATSMIIYLRISYKSVRFHIL